MAREHTPVSALAALPKTGDAGVNMASGEFVN